MTNLDRVAEIFPECVTETEVDGKLTRAINFDTLRQLLSDELIDGREAYEFNFVGKKRAQLDAHAATSKTLRPDRNLSRDFDTTQNLYIEGDNLDALKILTESYLGRVKLIYIDPPYNTGNDFIYRDNFKQSESDFADAAGNVDGDGNRLRKNPESNGRFHSDWCAMIYARLALAKHFLSDDGVIFISIDDHEQATLKLICDELFGEKNFVAQICVKRSGGRQDSKYFAVVNEYLLCYAKDATAFTAGENVKADETYPKFDAERGRHYKTQLLRKWGAKSRRADRPNLFYPITAPDDSEVYPMLSANEDGRWRWRKTKMREALYGGLIEFVKNGDMWTAYEKIYAPLDGQARTKKFTTWLDESFAGGDAVKNLLGGDMFPYPKSVGLIERVLKMGNVDAESIVLDFFSGSATTAQVTRRSATSGGNEFDVRAGTNSTCGRERIRRAGDKLKAAHPTLDTGFRTFKVDESNFVPLPEKITQETLAGLVDNIKSNRNAWDLLFGALLDMGLTLDLPVASEMLDGFEVLSYGDEIIACFGKNIPPEVFDKLASRKVRKIIFRDAAFKNTSDKLNALERFEELGTEVKVL